ncbi:MAG: hypothetical protein HFH35_10240 [Eubacterium sp.]|nr:hypothetical protein [Eubacterium sp.]
MPAVYAIDLIAKRDQKRKMDRSIVKGWNVHYETLEEAEAAARRKAEKLEKERAAQEASQEKEQAVKPGRDSKDGTSDDGYNAKTNSYSGHYGKQPVKDESEKQQIDAILGEKKAAFDAALSEIQAQV